MGNPAALQPVYDINTMGNVVPENGKTSYFGRQGTQHRRL